MKYLGKISNKTNYKFITSIPLFENSHVIKSKPPFSFYYLQNFWNSESEIDKIFQHKVVWFWYEIWKSESESFATHSGIPFYLDGFWLDICSWNPHLNISEFHSVQFDPLSYFRWKIKRSLLVKGRVQRKKNNGKFHTRVGGQRGSFSISNFFLLQMV